MGRPTVGGGWPEQAVVDLTEHWISGVVAIVAHGRAVLTPVDGSEFRTLAALYTAHWWQDLHRAGRGAFPRVELSALYTWARNPTAFPPT